MHGLAGIRSTSAGVNARCCFVNKFGVSTIWGPHPLCCGSVRRGAIVRASTGETSPQETSAKPYTNRLHTNPAYQRLKARKQQPQEAGPPSSHVQGAETSGNKQSGSGSMADTPRPSPGLSHRQRDRPVRQLSSDPGKASSSNNQSPSQHQPSQADATPTAQTQSPAVPPQDAAQRPRASLQPLSAMQQKPYASANSQAPVRHADFAEGQQGTNAVATVQFWLTFHAEFGQRLRVVGSHKNLGSWIMVDGPELRWTEGDRWHANITLPSGSVYEYKYVVLDSSGTHALTWQRGNNSVLAIQQDEPELEVFDNWEGQPGAAVMAGGKSSTRESKLLAWATDIEAQLGLQRQELRSSRIELASAQEDARRARQEARAVRMELAQSQSVRAQADRLIRELQSSNRLLKSELQATTTTFKQALHAAQTMLDRAEEREQDIPGKLEQEAESEATDAMPSKLATGTPDLAGDAVSNTSEETNTPVKRGLEGPADTVTNSGMQGQVAESATSSNARQQSTASVASTRPASASKPTSTIGKAASNTQARPKSPSSQGFFESNSSDASIPMASSSKAGPLPSPAAAKADFASQPQTADLPKHGKPAADNAAAAPPKAPGTFPDSEAPISPHQASPEGQSAGHQLETARTAVPVHTQDSNAAASKAASSLPDSEAFSKSGQTEPEEQCAGKQLETARMAVPVAPQESNATASQVPSSVSHQSEFETDQATHEDDKAGKQLETAHTAVPVDERESNLAASQTVSSMSQSKVRKHQDQSAAGKELETARTAVPPGTKASNAAAAQAPAVQSRQESPDVQDSGDPELATANQAISETMVSGKNTAGGKESLAAAQSNGVSAKSASSRSRSAPTKKSTPMSSS